MKHFLITTAIATTVAITPAIAAPADKLDGTPLSDDAKTKLGIAMKDAGCEVGEAVQQDEYVAVTGTKCGNRAYNLRFNRDFKVEQKEEVN